MILDVIHELSQRVPDAFEPGTFLEEERWLDRDFESERILTGDRPFGDWTRRAPWGDVVWGGGWAIPDPVHSDRIDSDVKRDGMDRLAFYRSYHFDRDRWGIYILEDGLSHLAAKCMAAEDADPLDAYQRAFKLLYLHEFFHFLADVASTALELALLKPLYVPFRRMSNPRSELEEGLANAFAVSRIGAPTRWVKEFMASQPTGYRDFNNWRTPEQRTRGWQELTQQLITPSDASSFLPLGELLIDSRGGSVSYWDVPVHMVRSATVPTRSDVWYFVTSIATLTKTPTFRRDFDRLPESIQRKWPKAERFLSTNAQHAGLDFKKLKNSNGIFRARVDQKYRFTLRQGVQGSWELLRIGKHDDLDEKPI